MKTARQSYSIVEKALVSVYFLFLLCFTLYSYTQIDLGLAISRSTQLQSIVRSFQEIGYFQRPLATNMYFVLLILFFVQYGMYLYLTAKKLLSRKIIWISIIASSVFLLFSYTAFSYDIFNYIFDAKIVTQYHSNPYLHKALDFPGDPMLGFMHWTHRVYPYGPFWLALTIPLSFAGFGFFLPTYFLFKLLTAVSYLGSVWFLEKTIHKIHPQKALLGVVFFGLNPLIVIESLMTNHVDIVMTVFSLASIYALMQKKYIQSIALFVFSVGIKFVTGFLFPVFFYAFYKQRKNSLTKWQHYYFYFLLTMTIGVIAEIIYGTFQPWYLIPVIAYASIFAGSYLILVPTFIISFFALLTYVPFLFFGNWDPPIPKMLSDLYFFSYAFAFFITTAVFLYKQVRLAKQKKVLIFK